MRMNTRECTGLTMRVESLNDRAAAELGRSRPIALAVPPESRLPLAAARIATRCPAGLVTKASRTYETPEPTQTPSGRPNPSRRGFLKGIRTRVSSLGHGASSVAKPCSVQEPSLSECPPRLSLHRRAQGQCRCSNKTSPPRSFR
jgi:hypothetical protein